MSYLSLFTFFMLILITADNFLQLFLGWEGVGFCSYILINFWFTRLQANKSAIKAMLVNKVGDCGLALGIFLIFVFFKSVDFNVVFCLIPYFVDVKVPILNCVFSLLEIICFFLFLAVLGKSAQIGLHSWLPDAMEGPTPVSALIHAATMVTAGVFLLIRCSFIYEYAPDFLSIVVIFGAITAFFAGIIGLFQNDLKKIIAFSTCSQLGYMVFSCGLSNYSIAIFHVFNHGYFKALLFLSAGSIIHSLSDEQDLRRLGGLLTTLPFTYSMTFIGSFALMGFPFLTGFYSKDLILEIAYSKFTVFGNFAYFLGLISASITAFYSFKLIYLTFLANPNGFKSSFEIIQDAPFAMAISLFVLSIGSVFLGFLSKELFVGVGCSFWNNSIYILPKHCNYVDCEFIPFIIKWLPFIFTFFGLFLSIFLYHFFLFSSFFIFKINAFNKIYTFFHKKFYFDKLQNALIVSAILDSGYNLFYKVLDKGLFEFVSLSFVARFLSDLSKQLMNTHIGLITLYAFYMFFFVFFLLCFYFIFILFLMDVNIYFLFILFVILDNKYSIVKL
jgi:NADH-ubiquinone oxidoreductase chain 5